MTVPLVMGYFKMNSAKRINELLHSPGIPVWQRNYYERLVGAVHEPPPQGLDRVRRYIRSNPGRWHEERENKA
jgi:hypothetical protein